MRKVTLLGLALLSLSASAYEARLTYKDTNNSSLASLIHKINAETGLEFGTSDFYQLEKREFATSNFLMMAQVVNGVPVLGANIRVWSNKETGNLIQAEMKINEDEQVQHKVLTRKMEAAHFNKSTLQSKQLNAHIMNLVNEVVMSSDDATVKGISTMDYWKNSDLVRIVKVRARRGYHIVTVSLLKNEVVSSEYKEFAQHDGITIPAQVYKMYEETEATHERLPLMMTELKYINPKVVKNIQDPFKALKDRKYEEAMYNPILAATESGWKQGFWSASALTDKAYAIANSFELSDNTFEDGLVLEGKYVSINIHPDAKEQFKGIEFELKDSSKFMGKWIETETGWDMLPVNGLFGKPIMGSDEIMNRVARRTEDHNPVTYINDGFDEVQVYWSVTTLMESLHSMGFTDPELSTRPFSAFLYDPDIGMRDNAYYTEDTINFTTYSPDAQNYARDNSTIWHELGHGIMDRLMGEGDFLQMADTGGLSEGMADFVAQLVVHNVMKGESFPGEDGFRIINNPGFSLTNEVHDDGEAYGGAMYDILSSAEQTFGFEQGLAKMADLTMETMRYTRSHEALTANVWFGHMLFADELGSNLRKSGEFHDLIINALHSRNFSLEGLKVADMNVKYNGTELTSKDVGSRNKPITLEMKKDESISYDLKVKLIESEVYKFKFPVVVKVEFKKGALQGAVKWEGEDHNPLSYTLNSAEDVLDFKVKAYGECDSINQPDGTCKDYAYIQIYNSDNLKKPVAKKRFYLKIKTQE